MRALTRLLAAGQIADDVDLVLIEAVGGVGGLEPSAAPGPLAGWSVAAAAGDLGVRYALASQPTRLAVAVTCRTDALQADLRERAALRHVVRPLARDVLAALAGRECAAIDEGLFGPALRALIEKDSARLFEAASSYTWSDLVRESDAIGVLGTAALGTEAAGAESPAILLAQWLASGTPPIPAAARGVVQLFLQRRFPRDAALLDDALAGGARQYAVDTALRPCLDAKNIDPAYSLVRAALRHLLEDERRGRPDVVAEVLRPAEDAFVAGRFAAARYPLLRQATLNRVRELAGLLANGEVPANLADLDGMLYAMREGDVGALLRIGRLVRALAAAERLVLPESVAAFAQVYRGELAWGDLAARRVRDASMTIAEVAAAADATVTRWYALRDRWNDAYANLLSRRLGQAMHARDAAAPLGLHRVLGEVVRPLAQHEGRVFLVVLDGCDYASFIDIATALDGIGTAPCLPPARAELPVFDPAASGRAHVALALAPLPTITSHARRALFAGAIPAGAFLDEVEAQAGNATRDRDAFAKAVAMQGITGRLFLKNDLIDNGQGLVAELEAAHEEPRVIAAVFNVVDDALSSKESTPLPQWTLGRLGPALQRAVVAALTGGWPIVVTADHGNTPARPGTRARPGFKGARYIELPQGPAPAGAVLFDRGDDVPRRIATLSAVGEHGGPAFVGYHGGASLEETLVPLALLGSGTLDRSSIGEPSWWNAPDSVRYEPDVAAPRAPATIVTAAPTPSAAPAPSPAPLLRPAPRPPVQAVTELPAGIAEVLGEQELAILDSLRKNTYLDDEQIARAHGVRKGFVRGRVADLIGRLEAAGLPPLVEIDDEPARYRWIGD